MFVQDHWQASVKLSNYIPQKINWNIQTECFEKNTLCTYGHFRAAKVCGHHVPIEWFMLRLEASEGMAAEIAHVPPHAHRENEVCLRKIMHDFRPFWAELKPCSVFFSTK